MSRRQFITGVGVAGLGLLAGCGRLPWPGQPQPQPAKSARIGWLSPSIPETNDPSLGVLLQELREYGWVDGATLTVERRYGANEPGQLPAGAAELVALNVDLIVAAGPTSARAAKDATSNIPIVMTNHRDPVGSGLVASLARPGGNITGLSSMDVELSAKRLELLKVASPAVSRVGLLWNPGTPGHRSVLEDSAVAARALDVELVSLEVRDHNDTASVFDAAGSEGVNALIPLRTPLTVNHGMRIATLAAERRMPIMAEDRRLVEAGGLMAYGTNQAALHRRSAYYVDRILKGTKPADLPIEQPMTFEFIVNMKTARELGITFPHEVALQITEVIE